MTHPFAVLDPGELPPPGNARAAVCAFAVMAKAPVAGRVKTRLSPPLTPTQAALLNADFLRDTLGNLQAAGRMCAGVCVVSCVVSYTPVGEESAFRGILPDTTLLLPQRGGDFGERLLLTATDLFRCGFGAVCLIDSDSPTVPTGEFARAAQVLLDARARGAEQVVLGRSDDGGYYLLGMTAPLPGLFAEIAWSTAAVAEQTERRAAELGVPVHLLQTWYDVDDGASLGRLRRELAGELAGELQGYDARHTRAFLEALDGAVVRGGS